MAERLDLLLRRPGHLDAIVYTVILIAYFLPWIDHPTAGLTFIGLDVSEWVKFLPQMRSGELPNRDFLYLPPIFLSGCLAATVLWRNRKRPSWSPRILSGLSILIGLLAFPSLDAIRFEAADQWRLRLVWIALLTGWTLIGVPLIQRLAGGGPKRMIGLWFQILLAAAGAILPAIALLPTRRVAAEWLNVDLTVGPGFWLSTLGFVTILLISARRVWLLGNKKAAPRPL